MGKSFFELQKNKVSSGYFKSLTAAINHANDFLGTSPLTEITPHKIDEVLYSERLINYRTNKPLSRKSIKNIRDAISNIFDFASEENPQIACRLHNPAKGRKIPSEARVTKREALPIHLQKLLVSTPGHNMYLSGLILLLCGLRRGELIPLMWSDIDFEKHQISVNKTVVEKNAVFIIKEGKAKTETSIRKVPIPTFLLHILEQEIKKSYSQFVCPQPNSPEMHTPASWLASWKSYTIFLQQIYLQKITKQKVTYKSNGLFKITPHILRHTYATMLFNANVDPLFAAKFLGHKSPDTTLKIYTHLQKEKVSDVIELYNAYIDNIFSTFSI